MDETMQTSNEKKILIITYYWPPSGGSGVQRWLKFVKYLPEYGWTPYVFTPENPAFALRDDSLIHDIPADAEVLRFPIWEPYDVFIKLSGFFGDKRKSVSPNEIIGTQRSLFQMISTWIRGNLFIPDPRIFWVRPSVKFLEDFIRDNKIKVVVTTGPPHSMHLIGNKLKKRIGVKWFADFRDPWSNWGFLDTIHVGPFARVIHRKLETKVLANADKILTITPFYVKQFENLSHRKVQLLTNGFDEEDFRQFKYERPLKFTLRHVGIINERCDPRPLLIALEKVLGENPGIQNDFFVDLVGTVHQRVRDFTNQSTSLSQVVRFSDAVPHSELLKMYGRSSILLLVLHGYKDAEGYMPGKLFEYMATGLPVLGVGPSHGDAAKVMEATGSGKMFESDNIEGIGQYLLKHYTAWKEGKLPDEPSDKVKAYSRKSITEKLVALLG